MDGRDTALMKMEDVWEILNFLATCSMQTNAWLLVRGWMVQLRLAAFEVQVTMERVSQNNAQQNSQQCEEGRNLINCLKSGGEIIKVVVGD